MSMAALARSERMLLCDLMLELGPDAPTLCEGWSVIDLAAHLVVREHDLWAAPGIVVGGPFRPMLEQAMRRRRGQGLERLVEIVRGGAPRIYRLVPSGAQLAEFFVHHEDVRRANGSEPRHGPAELDEALARLIRATGARLLSRVESGVDVVWNGGVLYRHGAEPRAVLSGPPGELILYLMGRRSAARVQLSGDSAAVEALEKAKLGI
ncbi:MAG: TIGR03085 family metal-binding protein [Actinomycetes bacterium]|jgi:uncharacterized protein (TIGR03085 family)|nr:TIGR03085 family protein [Acidimicrobiia bacterium]